MGVDMNDIHFGTDGWRAIIGERFTKENLEKVALASAVAFKEKYGLGKIYVGHDCRLNAHEFAKLASKKIAEVGFEVILTDKYCPTPTLCWAVAHDENAVGGMMITSSHNPAEYLGVKLRMRDGGASPKEFTDRVEEILDAEIVQVSDEGSLKESDIVSPYLNSLNALVDADAIKQAHLHVVLDPLYGAARGYLSKTLRDLNVGVTEINCDEDPTFDGLHPEPVPPWVDRGLAKVKELKADALFINDGDADRIGGGDCDGTFVNPHRILMLITKHLYEKGGEGRVVSTVTASASLARLCKKLNLDLTLTPVGFKWIYTEMKKGDCLVGGEESGGIGIPTHVMERDGLLMALLLTEMMAKSGKNLKKLIDDLDKEVGLMEFERRGLQVSDEQIQIFKNQTIGTLEPSDVCNKSVVAIDRRDGIKISLDDDSWAMMRPSGTEPLVRIYAESNTKEEVNDLLEWAKRVVMQ